MANIRGISDLPNPRAPPPVQSFPSMDAANANNARPRGAPLGGSAPTHVNGQPYTFEQQQARIRQQQQVPEGDEEDPDSEAQLRAQMAFLPPRHVFPTIGDLLCPRFTPISFIFLVSVLDIAMFVTALAVGATKYDGAFVAGNDMGGPSGTTFMSLGAKFLPYIKAGQVHRLLAAVFLHGGIMHLAANLFFQCRMGFAMEEQWGTFRMAVIYLGAGIGGNLMSCIGAPTTVSVGASGALFGILGGEIAWLLINWHLMQPNARNQELCSVMMVLVINFLIGGVTTLIDNWAHLGGLVFGMLIAASILSSFDDNPMFQAQQLATGPFGPPHKIRLVARSLLLITTIAFVVTIFTADL